MGSRCGRRRNAPPQKRAAQTHDRRPLDLVRTPSGLITAPHSYAATTRVTQWRRPRPRQPQWSRRVRLSPYPRPDPCPCPRSASRLAQPACSATARKTAASRSSFRWRRRNSSGSNLQGVGELHPRWRLPREVVGVVASARGLPQRRFGGLIVDALVRDLVRRSNAGRPAVAVPEAPGHDAAVALGAALHVDVAAGRKWPQNSSSRLQRTSPACPSRAPTGQPQAPALGGLPPEPSPKWGR